MINHDMVFLHHTNNSRKMHKIAFESELLSIYCPYSLKFFEIKFANIYVDEI